MIYFYRVNEVFLSIQGEGPASGLKSIFVRLAGCNLAKERGGCSWCDTRYAQDIKSGINTTVKGIMTTVRSFKCDRVCLSGGEPLVHNIIPLVDALHKESYFIDIETNGSLSLRERLEEKGWQDVFPSNYRPRCTIIMDVKTPASGMTNEMWRENIDFLTCNDVIKFVCWDEEDTDYAISVIEDKPTSAQLFISPVWGTSHLKEIAEAIKKSRFPFRLQTQLQKVVWGPKTRGV